MMRPGNLFYIINSKNQSCLPLLGKISSVTSLKVEEAKKIFDVIEDEDEY